MNPPSLPYPGHRDLGSQALPGGGYRIAYRDINPTLVHYVNNISISKGHRLVSGFFGFGLLVVGILDRLLGLAVSTDPNFTVAFGLLTSLILIFICFSRNFTIIQLMGILEQNAEKNGYQILTQIEEVKSELSAFETGKYLLRIPSPFLMLKGIELLPKS